MVFLRYLLEKYVRDLSGDWALRYIFGRRRFMWKKNPQWRAEDNVCAASFYGESAGNCFYGSSWGRFYSVRCVKD